MCCFWGHLLEANCRSLLRFLDLGMEETSEPTLFRAYFKKSFVLLLIYVDDHIIVVGPLSSCAALYGKLAGRYQIKETGRLPPGQVGSLGFLGRVICRTEHGGGLKLCLKPSYFDNIEEGPGRKSQSYQPTSQFGAVWATRPRDFDKFLDVWQVDHCEKKCTHSKVVSISLSNLSCREACCGKKELVMRDGASHTDDTLQWGNPSPKWRISSGLNIRWRHLPTLALDFACPVFPYIVAGKLSVESHFGWWTWFLLWWEARG